MSFHPLVLANASGERTLSTAVGVTLAVAGLPPQEGDSEAGAGPSVKGEQGSAGLHLILGSAVWEEAKSGGGSEARERCEDVIPVQSWGGDEG